MPDFSLFLVPAPPLGYLRAMPAPRIALLIAAATTAAAASDGRILPLRPELPDVAGEVFHSLPAPDGSLFLAGDFTAVDGRPRPGLAKLTPDGRLDRRFRPETVAGSGELALPFVALSPVHEQPLLLSRDGTLLLATTGRLLAFRPDGSRDRRFDSLHVPNTRLTPVSEHAGLLDLARIRADERRLEAYDAATLDAVPLPAQDRWPRPFLDAVPAGAGSLWVVGGNCDRFPPSPVTLFRVSSRGALDPSFIPVDLPGENSHSIAPLPDGGFRLVSCPSGLLQYWPSPTHLAHHIQWHSAAGDLLRSRRVILPIGARLLVAEEPDGSVVHNVGRAEDGAVNGAPTLVRLLPDGTRDPGFRVPLESLSLHRLPDGRFQHSHLHRILPDGSPDPAWSTPRLSEGPSVQLVGRLPDGATLAIAHGRNGYVGTNSLATTDLGELFLLDSRLRRDRRFRPPADLPPIAHAKIAADGAVVLSLAGDFTLPDGSLTRLLRLGRDGAPDPGSPRYRPPTSTFGVGPDGELLAGPPAGWFAAHPLPDGAFLIDHVNAAGEVPFRSISRMLADGTRDPGFSGLHTHSIGPAVLVLAGGDFLLGNAHHAADGRLLHAVQLDGARPVAELASGHVLFVSLRGYSSSVLTKWHPAAGIDPGFSAPFLDESWIDTVTPLADGTLAVTGHPLVTAAGTGKLVRLHADGSIDPAFHAPDPRRVIPRAPGLRTIVRGDGFVPATLANRAGPAEFSSVLHDVQRNRLLVAGDFSHLGTVPRPGMAALGLAAIRGYRAWAAAMLPAALQDPRTDADHDGAVNLHEYAVGSDPAVADHPPGLRVLPGDPPGFRLDADPAAAGVEAVLELSSNLRDWHPADGSAVTIEDRDGCVTWRLRQRAPAVFGRLRFVATGANP